MPKLGLKFLSILAGPAIIAMTLQTAAATKLHHARVKDYVTACRQWNRASSYIGMPSDGATLGNVEDMGPGTRENDPNVYRDGQPIPYYDINPHGG
jgi:hypothetical protein